MNGRVRHVLKLPIGHVSCRSGPQPSGAAMCCTALPDMQGVFCCLQHWWRATLPQDCPYIGGNVRCLNRARNTSHAARSCACIWASHDLIRRDSLT